MYFYLYKDTQSLWRWNIQSSGNHKIIAMSSESYHNRLDALHGIQLVKTYAASARVYDKSQDKWL